MNRPPKVPRPTPVPRTRSPRLADLSPAEVPRFWAEVGTLPLVEATGDDGERVVTFCLRDAHAEQVLLFANRLTDETDLDATLLERVPGTDLWHASFRMGSDWRASYSFLVQPADEPAPWLTDGHVALRAALDHGQRDPLNPAACRNGADVAQSVVELPDAPRQPWLAPRLGASTGTVCLGPGPDGRRTWLYDPPGHDPAEKLPLVVALDGEVWVTRQSLPTTLDNLRADGVTGPVRAVFPSSGGTAERWSELGTAAGVDFLVDELLPWTSSRRGVRADHVVVAGQSLGGITALRAGLSRPDAIAGVVSHSASLWQDDLGPLAVPGVTTHIHLAHGAQEWVLDGPHRELAAALVAAGVPLDVAVHNGGHDYAWWRGGIADGLAWVLPRLARRRT